MKIGYILGFGALGLAVVAAGVAAAYSADGLPQFGPTSVSTSSPIPHASSTPSDRVTFAVAGDSLTMWTGQEAGSWTSYVGTDGIEFTGLGWAMNGAPLSLIQASIARVDADVLVILAGTNDLINNPPISERLASVDAIVERSGVDTVVVSAVPPFNPLPAAAEEWNAALREHADQEGYTFVDPWASATEADGTFDLDKTVDGIHPVPATAAEAGAIFRRAIIAAAAD